MQEASLEGLPLFKNLTPEEKDELGALFEHASFGDGEVILEEGSPEEYFYVIVSGTVEVQKEVFPGRWQHLATLEAPGIVGEISLMTGLPAAATVTTRGPVEAWRLPHGVFLEKLEAGSSVAYKVVYEIGRTLGERMWHTDESIAKIVSQLEDAESDRDLDVFRDKLIREWSF